MKNVRRGWTMFLFLIQHAEAKSKDEDPARGLSEKGIQDITRVANYASKLDIKASGILHSGKLRAQQTARVLADYLKIDAISETDGLGPMDDPGIWFERLTSEKENRMLVGHLPHLDKFSSLLLSGDSDKKIIDFKMGGIVCLKKLEGNNFAIGWMITPEGVK
jgi:phosphohistidine phosphatase